MFCEIYNSRARMNHTHTHTYREYNARALLKRDSDAEKRDIVYPCKLNCDDVSVKLNVYRKPVLVVARSCTANAVMCAHRAVQHTSYRGYVYRAMREAIACPATTRARGARI